MDTEITETIEPLADRDEIQTRIKLSVVLDEPLTYKAELQPKGGQS